MPLLYFSYDLYLIVNILRSPTWRTWGDWDVDKIGVPARPPAWLKFEENDQCQDLRNKEHGFGAVDIVNQNKQDCYKYLTLLDMHPYFHLASVEVFWKYFIPTFWLGTILKSHEIDHYWLGQIKSEYGEFQIRPFVKFFFVYRMILVHKSQCHPTNKDWIREDVKNK